MFKSIANNCRSNLAQKRPAFISYDNIDLSYADREPFFRPYQIHWCAKKLENTGKPKVIVQEKSRQIGWSFVTAYLCVEDCVSDRRDCVYTSYNKESAKQFIKDARRWCNIFNIGFEFVAKSQAVNPANYNVFEIKFNNGRTLTAIAGNATNLRAKPGNGIVIDEAAYREESLDDIIAAAMATIITGGWILIASTHAGKDSDFAKLIQDIKDGKRPYDLITTTFRQAVKDGFYRSVCEIQKIKWSKELEESWVKSIYEFYGIRASEELDVIPGDFSGGDKIFTPAIFAPYRISQFDPNLIYFRYYDLASSTNANAFFSADVMMAYDTVKKLLIVVDYNAGQLTPLEGDNAIEETVKRSPYNTIHLIEIEPGSSGIKYVEYMKERLSEYDVYGYRPVLAKLQRAIPVSAAAQKGKIVVSDALFDETGRCEFLEIIRKFDGTKKTLVNDLVDCLSGIYDYVRINYFETEVEEESYDSMYG